MGSFAMTYPFGAAGAPPPADPAPPPAGAPGAPATPAALSSAAFTAWPLNVRVGANSPSLCPTICSVTYTGINFLPLCTAIVWPIRSGRIVERRDHVLMTFFSLRAFIPSTFSRRWLSMNGPFLSERAIVSPYSSTRRSLTHCARRSLRNPRTGPWTRCETGQNGHTNRVPCAFGVFSTLTAQPGLQNRYSTCTGATATNRAVGLTGFAGRAGRTDLLDRATRRVIERVRLLRDALMVILATCSQIPAAPDRYFNGPSKKLGAAYGLRR